MGCTSKSDRAAAICVRTIVERADSLLRQEAKILDAHECLREERAALLPVLHDELIVFALLKHTLDDHLVREARTERATSCRGASLRAVNEIGRLIKIIRLLTSEVEMFESSFDFALAELAALGIRIDRYEDAVLHGGWAVSANHLQDIALKYAGRESGE